MTNNERRQPSMVKQYLGDSVYADFDQWGALILTTENGLPSDPSNRIILEPSVIANLDAYLAQRRRQIAALRSQEDADTE